MNIGISSHTGGCEEIKVVDPIVEHMDDYSVKGKFLEKNDYGSGVGDFLIISYVVFSDEAENEEFAKPSHKIQRMKDYYGDQGWIKTMVFALPFNPDKVRKMSLEQFRVLLCNTVLEKLENPEMKILKAFNYENFKNDISKEIINYRDNIKIDF